MIFIRLNILLVIGILCFLRFSLAQMDIDQGKNNLNYKQLQDRLTQNINLSDSLMNEHPASAFRYAYEALIIARKLNDNYNKAMILNKLGEIRKAEGNYVSAMTFFLKSLRISDMEDNKFNKAKSFINVAAIYLLDENDHDALENAKKALALFRQLRDNKGIAMSYHLMSRIRLFRNETQQAKKFADDAVEIQKEQKDLAALANTYITTGKIHIQQKAYAKALSFFNRSLEIRRQLYDNKGIAGSYLYLGRYFRMTGRPDSALLYFKKSRKICLANDYPRILKENYHGMSKCYASLDNYREAYDNHVQFKSLSDSLLREESIKKTTQLEMQYEQEQEKKILELEKQKKELDNREKLRKVTRRRDLSIIFLVFLVIVSLLLFIGFRIKTKKNHMLSRQKDHISRQNERLKLVSATKDKFFSIIAHDLKNPFQSIIGLADLFIKQYDTLKDNEKLEYLQIINETSRKTHKLLDNLLQWARTQTESIKYMPEKVNLKDLTSENILLQKEAASKKDISIHSDIETDIFVYIDKYMIDTVIRNITSNAIKFTPEGGEVKIFSQDAGGFVEVVIEDTGIGIPQENIDKLFIIDSYHSTKGTFKETGTGIGLIISKEFIEKNGGEIKVESRVGEGSRFSFTIPKFQEQTRS
jgi:signal transduction histidine kinase